MVLLQKDAQNGHFIDQMQKMGNNTVIIVWGNK